MLRTVVSRGVLAASRPLLAWRAPISLSPYQNPVHQPTLEPNMSTRAVLRERVHDLVGDAKMPGQLKGEVGVKAVAIRDIKAGEVIFRETGDVQETRTMHTIQISLDKHFNMAGEARFTAHSPNPNCKVVIFEASTHPIDFVAIKDIPLGTALSFDYCTTEWDMTCPFDDFETGSLCSGFKHLSAEERKKRFQQGLVPAHILKLWLAELASIEGSSIPE